MYNLEKTREEQRQNPSFSSTLLDHIYRSIGPEFNNFYAPETTPLKKQISKINVKDDQGPNLRHAWKSTEKVKKTHHMETTKSQREQDQDVHFFSSSTSTSSDSSSGLLSSSSDTESMFGGGVRLRSRVSSCFAPLKPKPVKTSIDAERRISSEEEEVLIKSKSRVVKIYNNLKPISPGGKLTSFLNSLFTNTKKTKSAEERKGNSGHASSSASSFARSCLSKNSPSSKEKNKLLRNGVKRTVRFYPVSVILDEDSRPCGHKCLYDTSVNKKKEGEEEAIIMEKSRRVEEAARELLREYHHKFLRDFPTKKMEEDIIEDDDASSCSSSDLFELDHLVVMGGQRYCQELPVYETTNLSTNRDIANGLIM